VKKAKDIKKPTFLKANAVLENMRELATLSAKDIEDVLKADPIITPSTFKIEKGMTLKKAAERKPAAEGFKKLEKLLLLELARASLLLAHSWDEAYKAAGSPAVKGYKSYQYPFTPDFVKPDYF
jgi:hypothetical protein